MARLLIMLTMLMTAGCGGQPPSAMDQAKAAGNKYAAALVEVTYARVQKGWTQQHVEKVFGTNHHDSSVLWTPKADVCWVYSWGDMPSPRPKAYTFCFDSHHRLVLKAKGIS
jgi:hypothetical protein